MVTAVLAVVFGATGLHRAEHLGGVGKGQSLAGLILGMTTFALGLLLILVSSISN